MKSCVKCGKSVSYNEVGLSKKLINRNTSEFYCIDCLAQKFKVSPDLLKEKIKQFLESGCTLFIEE